MNTPTPHAESATKVICGESYGSLEFVINAAVSDAINGAAPHLPPLLWMIREDRHSSYFALTALPDTEAELDAWAAELGLSPVAPSSVAGTRRVEGAIIFGQSGTQHRVKMWCIVDEAAYRAAIGVRTPEG